MNSNQVLYTIDLMYKPLVGCIINCISGDCSIIETVGYTRLNNRQRCVVMMLTAVAVLLLWRVQQWGSYYQFVIRLWLCFHELYVCFTFPSPFPYIHYRQCVVHNSNASTAQFLNSVVLFILPINALLHRSCTRKVILVMFTLKLCHSNSQHLNLKNPEKIFFSGFRLFQGQSEKNDNFPIVVFFFF